MDLERREQPFVLAIRSNETLRAVLNERLGQRVASRLAASLPARAWQRLSAGASSKGERLYGLGPPPPDPLAATALEPLAAGPTQPHRSEGPCLLPRLPAEPDWRCAIPCVQRYRSGICCYSPGVDCSAAWA